MAPGDDAQSEEDVQKDDKVASSRAGKHGEDGEDGSYVGESSSDDAIDAGETGAEARSEEKRR
jgi:hypothetical protein